MEKSDLKKLQLPDSPGVYMFHGKKREVLYVGKATSLKDRVRSYFAKDIIETRGPRVLHMVRDAKTLTFKETSSVLEALILEAALIKKYQPPANVREKDNTSFNYLVITKETYPRVLMVRGRELMNNWQANDMKEIFGPFPQGGSLKEALKIVRKIFPFRDRCTPESGKKCFNAQIGLCPGVCEGSVTKKEYSRTITHIRTLFKGETAKLISQLGKEMTASAQKNRFEEAALLKRQIHALTHVRDVSLIERDARSVGGESRLRFESYDIAHTAGSHTVGAMTVLLDGEPLRGDYRKFIVKSFGNNDTAALREILERRFAHTEWPLPDLLIIDGGRNQLGTALRTVKRLGLDIPVVSVLKDQHHRAKEVLGDTKFARLYEKEILKANLETHRFAVAFHRKRRDKVI